MSVTQYIGARYVPLFAEPIEWDNTRAYEPLTIVVYQGNSYTSRQSVPIGIEIDNSEFWALTGNYNAQIEQYRREVAEFADDIEEATTIANGAKEEVVTEAAAREEAVQAEAAAREEAIQAEATAREEADEKLQENINNIWATYLNYYTPEQFNAVGDGETDDTQAFKDLFEHIPDYSTIILKSGATYRITEPLTLNKNGIVLTAHDKAANRPYMYFDFKNYVDTVAFSFTGYELKMSHIRLGERTTEASEKSNSYIMMFDSSNNLHPFNVDSEIEDCCFYNGFNAIGIVGRNIKIFNSVFSVFAASSIVVLQPAQNVPLRGFQIINNRFHWAGMCVNTSAITSYDETFNCIVQGNMCDFSKRIYMGISDNTIIQNNSLLQPTLTGSAAIIFYRSIRNDTTTVVEGNTINTNGAEAELGAFIHVQGQCGGMWNISNNTFYKVETALTEDNAIIMVATPNNETKLKYMNINNNNIKTHGSATPIQISSSYYTRGIIDGNSVVTKDSTNFITPSQYMTLGNNFTENIPS